MSELEQLIQQKKQLEQKIKELKNSSLIHLGVSKFEIDQDDHKYRLSIAGKQIREKYETKHEFRKRCGEEGNYYYSRKQFGVYEQDFWYTLIRAEDKQAVIDYIDQVINDFSEMKKTINEEGESNV